jgi:hypothetical protein
VLSAANAGNALATMAQVKEQIMLSGGVITSMAMTNSAFTNFVNNNTDSKAVFTMSEFFKDLRSADPTGVDMHAVFCYGWWDNPRDNRDGYWLCKNRCGTLQCKRVAANLPIYIMLTQQHVNAILHDTVWLVSTATCSTGCTNSCTSRLHHVKNTYLIST